MGSREVVPQLARALRDENVSVRRRTAVALATMGALARNAVSALVAVADDADHEFVEAVLGALVAIAPSDPRTLRAVRQAAEHPSWWVRDAAAVALADLGVSAEIPR